MAKITRFLSKVFGGSLSTSGNLTVIGSEASGGLAYSNDPAAMQALSEFDGGWKACVIGNNSPSIQDMQSLFFVLTKALQYIGQAGVCEWASDQTYYTGSFCSSAGAIYISITDANLNNAVTDTNNWVTLASTLRPSGQAKAWVTFDGTGGVAILSQYNVASVTRISGVAAGGYRITFSGSLSTLNYAAVCQTGNQGTANADFCRIGARSDTYIEIYSTTTNSTRVNSNYCNVVIYSNTDMV